MQWNKWESLISWNSFDILFRQFQSDLDPTSWSHPRKRWDMTRNPVPRWVASTHVPSLSLYIVSTFQAFHPTRNESATQPAPRPGVDLTRNDYLQSVQSARRVTQEILRLYQDVTDRAVPRDGSGGKRCTAGVRDAECGMRVQNKSKVLPW